MIFPVWGNPRKPFKAGSPAEVEHHRLHVVRLGVGSSYKECSPAQSLSNSRYPFLLLHSSTERPFFRAGAAMSTRAQGQRDGPLPAEILHKPLVREASPPPVGSGLGGRR